MNDAQILVIGGPTEQGHDERVHDVGQRLGEAIHQQGNIAVVCSLKPDSADFDVLRGVARAASPGVAKAVAHLPDQPSVRRWVDAFNGEIRNVRLETVFHQTPPVGEDESNTFAYLTCQLLAAERCNAVVTFGGRDQGAVACFLPVAWSRDVPIIPLRYLGGATEDHFWRERSTYERALGADIAVLNDPDRIDDALGLIDRLSRTVATPDRDRFFISYSRRRNELADVAENVLLRNDLKVFRDSSSITINDEWKRTIESELAASSVVVVLWSQEYACSPHCFVEMQQTLLRRARFQDPDQQETPELWVFRLDETRMTFPDVDQLQTELCRTRRELEQQLRVELDGWRQRHARPSWRA